VIMPQKKNPYSLAFVRGVAGVMIGRLASMSTVGRTPSAQVDNRIFAYGEVPRSLDLTIETVRLMSGVMQGLSVNAELMARRARDGYAQATDLAEVIMTASGLSYREAHTVVGQAVRRAVELGMPMREIGSDLIEEASRAVLGRTVVIPPDCLARAVDPASIVASRLGFGGAAPEPMRAMLGECRGQVLSAEEWRATAAASVQVAEDSLLTHAADVAGPSSSNGTRSTHRR
jgi:argininosuccinate lyase